MHRMHGYGWYSPNWWMIIFVIILIVGVFLLVRYIFNRRDEQQHAINRPLQILQERLVKGEIDVEEYEKLKRVLKEEENS